jgi:hypothetical protein
MLLLLVGLKGLEGGLPQADLNVLIHSHLASLSEQVTRVLLKIEFVVYEKVDVPPAVVVKFCLLDFTIWKCVIFKIPS